MARPRNPNAKPNVSIVKRKLKDGSFAVFNKVSCYDPNKKNSKTLSETRIGTLPADYKDAEKDLIPWVSSRKKKSTTIVKRAAETIQDTREQAKVKYPLAESLMAVFFAVLCGCTSCLQIQSFWKVNLKKLVKVMPKLPDCSISHDTIRRFVMLLGRDPHQSFFHSITSPLIAQLKMRRVAIDGQAVRASTIGDQKHPYIFNAYDADNGLVLSQTLIKAKENEITRSLDLLKDVNLTGCIVTADALNTQKKLVQFLVEEKDCDYCLAVKANHKELYELLQVLFSGAHIPKHQAALWQNKSTTTKTRGHGRVEERILRALPASLLPNDVSEQWSGLPFGTIVQAVTKTADPKTGVIGSQTRYFMSSLNFEEKYVAEKLAHAIRGHWAIENQLHWNLDVCFNQDRLNCSNADFINGMTSLNKIALNVQNKIKDYLFEVSEENLTRPMLMKYLTDVDSSVELVAKAFEEFISANYPKSRA